MGKFSLVRLLYIGVVVNILALLVVSGFSVLNQRRLQQNTEELHERPLAVMSAVMEFRLNIEDTYKLIDRALHHESFSEEDVGDMRIIETQAEKNIETLKKLYLGESSDVDKISAAYETVKRLSSEAIKIRALGGEKEAALYLEENGWSGAYGDINHRYMTILSFAKSKADEFRNKSKKDADAGIEQAIIFSSLFLLTTIVLSIIIMRFIKREFSKVEEFVELIDSAEYRKIEVRRGELLEFARLKTTLNTMVDRIIDSKNELEAYNEETLHLNESLMEKSREVEEVNHELEASLAEAQRVNIMLRAEKLRYKTLMDFASDGIHILDMEGNLVELSDSFAKMLGYTASEIATLSVFEIEAVIPREQVVGSLRSLANAQAIFESKHRKKDGSLIDVEINTRGITLDGKTHIYASARDITEKKEQERLLRRQKDEFETIFKTSKDGVAILDLDTNFLDFNDAYLEMTGFMREELLGKSCIELSAPWDISHAKEALTIVVEQGYLRNFEKTCIVKNDKTIVVNMSISLMPDKKRILISSQDVTERKHYEASLESLVAEEIEKRLEKEKLLVYQSKMAMMGEMIGAIAHQWRQPLNALGIAVQDILSAYEFDELDEEYIRNFETKNMAIIYQMSQTIDDFRNFFRPNKQKKSFSLERAVTNALGIMLAQLKNSFIEVKFDDSKEHIIYGYQNEFEQAVLIMISNAKDALLENKIKAPTIEIATGDMSDGAIFVSIEDNGGGVPKEIMDRVFEPYFTTKEQGKGTGIGLYMAKEIIERQMGGKIIVQNSDNGAKFTIFFYKSADRG